MKQTQLQRVVPQKKRGESQLLCVILAALLYTYRPLAYYYHRNAQATDTLSM